MHCERGRVSAEEQGDATSEEDALGLPSGPTTILFDLRLDDGFWIGLPFSSNCRRLDG